MRTLGIVGLWIVCVHTYAQQANTTLRELKAAYDQAGAFSRIVDNRIVRAVVVANDQGGNFSNQLVLQDETGGIILHLKGWHLYKQYPVGQRVLLFCRGLYLTNIYHHFSLCYGQQEYNGRPSCQAIPYNARTSFLLNIDTIALRPRTVTPDILQADLHDSLQNTLVTIDSMMAVQKGVPFADTNVFVSARQFVRCSAELFTLYTNRSSSMAQVTVPNGMGTITGVVWTYPTAGAIQRNIRVRTPADIQFDQPTCPIRQRRVSISHIKELAVKTRLPSHHYIIGKVLAFNRNAFITYGLVHDSSAGVFVLVNPADSTCTLPTNTTVRIDIGGLTVSSYKKNIQISRVNCTGVHVVSEEQAVTARRISWAQLWAQRERIAGSLVDISPLRLTLVRWTKTKRCFEISTPHTQDTLWTCVANHWKIPGLKIIDNRKVAPNIHLRGYLQWVGEQLHIFPLEQAGITVAPNGD